MDPSADPTRKRHRRGPEQVAFEDRRDRRAPPAGLVGVSSTGLCTVSTTTRSNCSATDSIPSRGPIRREPRGWPSNPKPSPDAGFTPPNPNGRFRPRRICEHGCGAAERFSAVAMTLSVNPTQAGPQPLTRAACLTRLEPGGNGRIAATTRSMPIITPVGFILLGDDIVFSPGPSEGLLPAIAGCVVAFQAERLRCDGTALWAVHVTGVARTLAHGPEAPAFRLSLEVITGWRAGSQVSRPAQTRVDRDCACRANSGGATKERTLPAAALGDRAGGRRR